MTEQESQRDQSLIKAKKINVDFGTSIIVNVDGVNTTLNSTLIGMEEDNFLIITPPVPFNTVKDKLQTGTMLVLKFFHKGVVYAFQAKIKNIITTAPKFLVVEYPKIIQDFSLRQHKRVPCHIPVVTKINDVDATGILKDLSEKGAFCIFKLSAATGLKVSDKLTMLCQFPGVMNRQPLEGFVRSLKRRGDNLLIGIEFITSSIKKDIIETIKQYITIVDGFDE